MTSQPIHSVIKALRNASSAIDKKSILLKADSPLLRKLLVVTYNPYITYGVRTPAPVMLDNMPDPDESMFDLLEQLASRKLTGDVARATVANYIALHGEAIKIVLARSFEAGISTTTINSVFPKLIPDFKIQKAKADVAVAKYPCLAQLKYNGNRAIAIVNPDSHVTFYSSNGHSYNFPHMEATLLELYKGCKPIVLDGEMIVGKGQLRDLPKLTGIMNSLMRGSLTDSKDVKFVVFDALALEEWDSKHCRTPYSQRYDRILVGPPGCSVEKADTWQLKDYEALHELYVWAINNDYEGLVAKQWSHFITFKRSADWVKLKAKDTADVECVGYEEGEGNREGGIGALLYEGKVNGIKVSGKVGSGLTAEMVHSDPNEFIGKTLEIEYHFLSLATAVPTLMHPRLVRVRLDK